MSKSKVINLILVCNLCLLLTSVSCASPKSPLDLLTRKQAVEDMNILIENVKAIHPDPFTGVSEAEFDARTQEITNGIGDRISRLEFAFCIAEEDLFKFDVWRQALERVKKLLEEKDENLSINE